MAYPFNMAGKLVLVSVLVFQLTGVFGLYIAKDGLPKTRQQLESTNIPVQEEYTPENLLKEVKDKPSERVKRGLERDGASYGMSLEGNKGVVWNDFASNRINHESKTDASKIEVNHNWEEKEASRDENQESEEVDDTSDYLEHTVDKSESKESEANKYDSEETDNYDSGENEDRRYESEDENVRNAENVKCGGHDVYSTYGMTLRNGHGDVWSQTDDRKVFYDVNNKNEGNKIETSSHHAEKEINKNKIVGESKVNKEEHNKVIESERNNEEIKSDEHELNIGHGLNIKEGQGNVWNEYKDSKINYQVGTDVKVNHNANKVSESAAKETTNSHRQSTKTEKFSKHTEEAKSVKSEIKESKSNKISKEEYLAKFQESKYNNERNRASKEYELGVLHGLYLRNVWNEHRNNKLIHQVGDDKKKTEVNSNNNKVEKSSIRETSNSDSQSTKTDTSSKYIEEKNSKKSKIEESSSKKYNKEEYVSKNEESEYSNKLNSVSKDHELDASYGFNLKDGHGSVWNERKDNKIAYKVGADETNTKLNYYNNEVEKSAAKETMNTNSRNSKIGTSSEYFEKELGIGANYGFNLNDGRGSVWNKLKDNKIAHQVGANSKKTQLNSYNEEEESFLKEAANTKSQNTKTSTKYIKEDKSKKSEIKESKKFNKEEYLSENAESEYNNEFNGVSKEHELGANYGLNLKDGRGSVWSERNDKKIVYQVDSDNRNTKDSHIKNELVKSSVKENSNSQSTDTSSKYIEEEKSKKSEIEQSISKQFNKEEYASNHEESEYNNELNLLSKAFELGINYGFNLNDGHGSVWNERKDNKIAYQVGSDNLSSNVNHYKNKVEKSSAKETSNSNSQSTKTAASSKYIEEEKTKKSEAEDSSSKNFYKKDYASKHEESKHNNKLNHLSKEYELGINYGFNLNGGHGSVWNERKDNKIAYQVGSDKISSKVNHHKNEIEKSSVKETSNSNSQSTKSRDFSKFIEEEKSKKSENEKLSSKKFNKEEYITKRGEFENNNELNRESNERELGVNHGFNLNDGRGSVWNERKDNKISYQVGTEDTDISVNRYSDKFGESSVKETTSNQRSSKSETEESNSKKINKDEQISKQQQSEYYNELNSATKDHEWDANYGFSLNEGHGNIWNDRKDNRITYQVGTDEDFRANHIRNEAANLLAKETTIGHSQSTKTEKSSKYFEEEKSKNAEKEESRIKKIAKEGFMSKHQESEYNNGLSSSSKERELGVTYGLNLKDGRGNVWNNFKNYKLAYQVGNDGSKSKKESNDLLTSYKYSEQEDSKKKSEIEESNAKKLEEKYYERYESDNEFNSQDYGSEQTYGLNLSDGRGLAWNDFGDNRVHYEANKPHTAKKRSSGDDKLIDAKISEFHDFLRGSPTEPNLAKKSTNTENSINQEQNTQTPVLRKISKIPIYTKTSTKTTKNVNPTTEDSKTIKQKFEESKLGESSEDSSDLDKTFGINLTGDEGIVWNDSTHRVLYHIGNDDNDNDSALKENRDGAETNEEQKDKPNTETVVTSNTVRPTERQHNTTTKKPPTITPKMETYTEKCDHQKEEVSVTDKPTTIKRDVSKSIENTETSIESTAAKISDDEKEDSTGTYGMILNEGHGVVWSDLNKDSTSLGPDLKNSKTRKPKREVIKEKSKPGRINETSAKKSTKSKTESSNEKVDNQKLTKEKNNESGNKLAKKNASGNDQVSSEVPKTTKKPTNEASDSEKCKSDEKKKSKGDISSKTDKSDNDGGNTESDTTKETKKCTKDLNHSLINDPTIIAFIKETVENETEKLKETLKDWIKDEVAKQIQEKSIKSNKSEPFNSIDGNEKKTEIIRKNEATGHEGLSKKQKDCFAKDEKESSIKIKGTKVFGNAIGNGNVTNTFVFNIGKQTDTVSLPVNNGTNSISGLDKPEDGDANEEEAESTTVKIIPNEETVANETTENPEVAKLPKEEDSNELKDKNIDKDVSSETTVKTLNDQNIDKNVSSNATEKTLNNEKFAKDVTSETTEKPTEPSNKEVTPKTLVDKTEITTRSNDVTETTTATTKATSTKKNRSRSSNKIKQEKNNASEKTTNEDSNKISKNKHIKITIDVVEEVNSVAGAENKTSKSEPIHISKEASISSRSKTTREKDPNIDLEEKPAVKLGAQTDETNEPSKENSNGSKEQEEDISEESNKMSDLNSTEELNENKEKESNDELEKETNDDNSEEVLKAETNEETNEKFEKSDVESEDKSEESSDGSEEVNGESAESSDESEKADDESEESNNSPAESNDELASNDSEEVLNDIPDDVSSDEENDNGIDERNNED